MGLALWSPTGVTASPSDGCTASRGAMSSSFTSFSTVAFSSIGVAVVVSAATWEPESLSSFVFAPPLRFFFWDVERGAGGGAPGTTRGVEGAGISGILSGNWRWVFFKREVESASGVGRRRGEGAREERKKIRFGSMTSESALGSGPFPRRCVHGTSPSPMRPSHRLSSPLTSSKSSCLRFFGRFSACLRSWHLCLASRKWVSVHGCYSFGAKPPREDCTV